MSSSTPGIIRVRQGPDGLTFRLEDQAGQLLASSTPFRTICRLEQALGVLHRFTKAPSGIASTLTETGCTLRASGQTGRLHFQEALSEAAVHQLLRAACGVSILDERPSGRRTTDVSGPLSRFALDH